MVLAAWRPPGPCAISTPGCGASGVRSRLHWRCVRYQGGHRQGGRGQLPQLVLPLHTTSRISAWQPWCCSRQVFNDGLMRTYELCNDSGATIVAENRSRDKHFTVRLECSGSTNVTPSRGSGDSIDCLPPMHRQVRERLLRHVPSRAMAPPPGVLPCWLWTLRFAPCPPLGCLCCGPCWCADFNGPVPLRRQLGVHLEVPDAVPSQQPGQGGPHTWGHGSRPALPPARGA